jgi:hypothetical protein
MLAAGSAAQAPGLETGLHYFAVEELDTHTVVQRGQAGSLGVAFSRLILAPNTRYRIWILQAASLRVGSIEITTPRPGIRVSLPAIQIRLPNPYDSDNDGLHDTGEFILGTIASDEDSDDDGIRDGAEVVQGSDPLDGIASATGLIGSASTPDTALDVCALNDIAAVAHDSAISVFNVFNAMSPVIVAQVAMPQSATRVACAGDLVAVAANGAGLAVVDLTDPPAASILHQIDPGGPVVAVATAASLAYAGLSSGDVVAIDMVSGIVLGRNDTGTTVDDLAVGDDALFVLERSVLRSLELTPTGLAQFDSISVNSTGPAGLVGRRRLFVGGQRAYVSTRAGYEVYDVSDPAALVRVGTLSGGPLSFKQIVLASPDLAVAPVGVFGGGPHDLTLYDTSDPSVTNASLGTFTTPGAARSVAIYNGIAYVADSDAGLQVVNYVPFDALGIAPTVDVDASFPFDPADPPNAGQAEEGKLVRVSAIVSDDVQVRNVEFSIDGQVAVTDGSFPFEHRFITPPISQTSFRLRLRASDTGGNATTTPEYVITLVPDATPPVVLSRSPADGAALTAVDTVAAYFDEPLDEASVLAGFTLAEAGGDGSFGTGDDVPVAAATEYRADVSGAFLEPTSSLATGLYRATIGATVSDLAGNSLAADEVADFIVYGFGSQDSDGDGVPDVLEALLGLDPGLTDSDGDGTPDGAEDFDGDGLTNAGEVASGTDPTNNDSNGNGILDGAEDGDLDGLGLGAEFAAGTNPLDYDTDDDTFPDGVELEPRVATDPLDPTSFPPFTIVALDGAVGVNVPDFTGASGNATWVAPPPIGVVRFDSTLNFNGATLIARPPVSINRVDLNDGTVVAQPPVSVEIQP